ncbi:adenylate/guanylate cyclase domain-containing protein [Ruegeria sp. AU67]|uniref:adenylate/guanylate cyclase domain-containing protein n=1 Tax=Ruegeria sp. AU67 TaxID=2108530 RepID=UPI000D69072E|nr:tetratricopeptide repeat protein [Ruegeria sp. AU67]
MERRLTTIVAADIAGFSRLVDVDEEGTLATQRALRVEFLDPLITQHDGRIANTAGDSLLIEFPSAVQAVRCAIAMQEGVAARNADTPEDRRILFRLGINVGDVLPDGDDLLGDGVNVAARLEALASPGGIMLSRTVRDQVRDKVEISLEDMGEIQVKNIARPVRAFRIAGKGSKPASQPKRWRKPTLFALACLTLVIVAAVWWMSARTDFEPVSPAEMALELPDGSSIAVMPFAFIGVGEVENGYLADGISENIITNLAKLPDLLVIAQSSSFSLKDEGVDVRGIARRFGVRYVLQGSVQKSGERLRITAQLLDAVAGQHLWSETFDRKTGDFFDIQDEITLAVLERVHGGAIDGDRLNFGETSDLDAFSQNAKGRSHRSKFTAEDNKIARMHYEAALARDSNYLDALVGLGFTHVMDVRLGFTEDRSGSLALAEEYLSRALEHDPDRPATLSNYAVLRVVQKRGAEAQEFVRRAFENGAGDARVVRGMAWVLKYSGASKESLTYFSRAKRITPVPLWWLIADEFGAFLDSGNFEAANEAIESYLAVVPEIYRAEFLLFAAVASWHEGDLEKAKALIAEARELKPAISIGDLRPFDLAYIDRSIPERRYAVLRDLGLPD